MRLALLINYNLTGLAVAAKSDGCFSWQPLVSVNAKSPPEFCMSLAVVYSRASLGVDAPLVSVEVHLSNGLPAFNIVGLPEASVKESRDRVRSALINGNFEFPAKRITVNLAPADLPKV